SVPCSLMTPPSPTSTLFPYTTLFRSLVQLITTLSGGHHVSHHQQEDQGHPPHVQLLSGRGQEGGGDLSILRCGHHGVRSRSGARSEEHTSELQSLRHLVCRLLLEKKK